MAVSAAVLRELHRIHGQLSDLNARLVVCGPRQIQAREIQVVQQQTALSAEHDTVKQTKMATDQKQLELKSSETKIEDLKTKLNGCSSNREYQALLEQISAAEMANSVLADEILEAMEKADELELNVGQAEKNLETATNEMTKCRDTVANESEVIRADIERLESELRAAEQGLPVEFKIEYDRVIRAKGADGMAEVEEMVCQGCGFQITLNMQNDLLLSKPVFCKSCGCLLYIGEG